MSLQIILDPFQADAVPDRRLLQDRETGPCLWRAPDSGLIAIAIGIAAAALILTIYRDWLARDGAEPRPMNFRYRRTAKRGRRPGRI